MKSLKQLCVPRESVFDAQRRDTVLDISDLIEDRIDAAGFFEENFVTEGMKTLLEQGFRRLEGKSSQGIFKLTQAMGGGKTHNLLAFGLLAKDSKVRNKVMADIYKTDPYLGNIDVIGFSGRESDAPLGIWGAIAEQLGEKDHFKDSYSPLKAPGQTAWENLFSGKTVLIMLDELAPYLENAKSISIGNSDLAKVTGTALSNLLVALGKESCSRICLVISELAGAYQSGGQQLSDTISDFEKETHRTAMTLEPVRLNSDELYHILRTRIFKETPSDREIEEVAQAYAKAMRDAKQMAITSESPEQFANRIHSSYPFHPAIRDLYARFRENPGFQQTRGLIRLMRIITSRLWNSGLAEKKYLIAAHDLDFNERETRAELTQINNTLENAIAHDIASSGNAVAEVMDSNLEGSDAQDACKLLLMASMSNVPNAVLGLSIPELVAYMAAPGRDLTRLKSDVLEKLSTAVWYLHINRDGKLFFKNVQNLNAKLESLVRAYIPEQAIRELRSRLELIFKPTNGWCYQQVLALPAVDEIELDQNKINLVISEPKSGVGLRKELLEFFNQATWKNRVAFLTGSKDTYDLLIDTGKRLKAIQQIIGELESDNLKDDDPQMIQAKDISDIIQQNFHSAVRETFTLLWYPIEEGLVSADFRMKFDGNRYNGEQQIVELLKEKMKFTEDIEGENFRKKCEQRLFTTQSLPWIEILKRAASNTKWQWHHPGALEALKTDCILKDIWRSQGGYIDKGPFPKPKTNVLIQEVNRDSQTGEVSLKLTPANGDTVYYDIGGEASEASCKVDSGILKTKNLRVSFLAVDSRGIHETGDAVEWVNRITLQHRTFQAGNDKRMELKAIPEGDIRYSTDGSNPKDVGATYKEPFLIPRETIIVLAYASKDGIESEVERITIDWEKIGKVEVDIKQPVVWHHRHGFNSTKDSYAFLEMLAKYEAKISGMLLTISGESGDKEWVELNMYEHKLVSSELIEECLEMLRKLQGTGQVQLVAERIHFDTGQALLDFVEELKTELQAGEVKQ